jgi:hypothetical protein
LEPPYGLNYLIDMDEAGNVAPRRFAHVAVITNPILSR